MPCAAIAHSTKLLMTGDSIMDRLSVQLTALEHISNIAVQELGCATAD